ncbi:bestrophin-like domain [Methylotetracoccus oryzae]|uniref:bestrophin-like domain n=1 Tax=Methylotetracoccus oryzae TaxID=1919059 RepID=UPI001119EF79|nr:DUF4239 domain-containing protein [Methylotetracoccus oryzae]
MLQIYWLYDLPNWLLCLLILVLFTGGSILGQRVSRRFVRRFFSQALEDHNEAVGAIIGSYGVFYGITLGLIAVATWDNFDASEDLIMHEASALSALDRDVSALPEPASGELRALLRDYLDFVIDRAWPEHRKGRVPVDADSRINAFQKRLVEFEPRTERESVLFAEAIEQFNVMFELRRDRISSIGNGLPPILWGIVLAGAILNMILLYVLRIEPLRTHMLLIGLVATFIGLMIFFIVAMDHPFVGELSIEPTAFEALRQGQMSRLPGSP